MEVDRYLGEEVPPKFPILRLYTWDKPTISFGCNQNPDKRLLLELCTDDGIPVVKRPTGGRELLHGHDICYTVAWPQEKKLTAVEAKNIFALINNALVEAFSSMGIKAEWNEFRNRPRTLEGPCFAQVDTGELTVDGKKLVGSAQRLFEKCIIQQGSIPLFRPSVDLVKYLRQAEKTRIRSAMDGSATYLADCLGKEIQFESLISPFMAAFEGLFGGPSGPADSFFEEIKGIIETLHGTINDGK
jgi:lipoyl(octanoyl) transferase